MHSWHHWQTNISVMYVLYVSYYVNHERCTLRAMPFRMAHCRNPVPIEQPSVTGLIILAQEIMRINWDSYGETVAFLKSTFCLVLHFRLAKYWFEQLCRCTLKSLCYHLSSTLWDLCVIVHILYVHEGEHSFTHKIAFLSWHTASVQKSTECQLKCIIIIYTYNN